MGQCAICNEKYYHASWCDPAEPCGCGAMVSRWRWRPYFITTWIRYWVAIGLYRLADKILPNREF